MGNTQLLACTPATGVVRRFITGPVNCELTGATWTPDGRTMFVNVQHPGEGSGNDGAQPRRLSNWPDFSPVGRPRAATVVIRRLDGGVVGT
jgi:secreted PhoX family phosphatase